MKFIFFFLANLFHPFFFSFFFVLFIPCFLLVSDICNILPVSGTF